MPIPMGNRVVLESFPDDLRGAALIGESRIIIPSMYTESSRLSKVIALGAKVNCGIAPGDIVFSGRYPPSAQAFKHEDKEFVSVDADDILARIDIKEDICLCLEPECRR